MANVLLVDDYRPIRSAVSRYLRFYGHRVTEAANARSALEQADERVDVVVTALTMPGSSGSELARALRDRGVTAPVIIMSGQSPPPEETLGAACMLVRPFEPLTLVQAVDRVSSAERADAVAGAS